MGRGITLGSRSVETHWPFPEVFRKVIQKHFSSALSFSAIAECNRKLPHQVDNSKLEIPVLNVLGMNSMGVLSPRESWGLNSL